MSVIQCAKCNKISSIDREGYCQICFDELDAIEERNESLVAHNSLDDAEFLKHLQELNSIVISSSPPPEEEVIMESATNEVVDPYDLQDNDRFDTVATTYMCEIDGCGNSSEMTTFHAGVNICSSCCTILKIDEEPKVWSFGKRVPVVHILCNNNVVKHTILFDKLKVGVYTTLQLYTSDFWTIPPNGIYSYKELSAFYNTNTNSPVIISIG
jgi:hypothetical protein